MVWRTIKRHKFNAKPVNADGQHFPSKLEYEYYRYLCSLRENGEICFFLRQVPLHLPGGVKYVVDFLVFMADGTCRFIDVKGMETPTFDMKKKIVESIYPLEIEIIKKGMF